MEILDGDAVTTEVKGMDGTGWSNSPHAEHAPDDNYPEVAPPEEVVPGFSNAKAVGGEANDAAADPQQEPDNPAPAKKAAAKKTTAKKTAAKKG